MATYLSIDELKKLGAQPLFDANEVTDVWNPSNYKVGGGQFGIGMIKYKLPTGQVFEYRKATPYDSGYAGRAGSFELTSGTAPEGYGSQYDLNQLLQMTTNRNVSQADFQDYHTGKIGLTELQNRVLGTPTYDRSKGPIVNGVQTTNFQTNPGTGTGFTADGVSYAPPQIPQQPTQQQAQQPQQEQSQPPTQQSQAPQQPRYAFQRNLEPGMQGDDVKALQNFLISQGYQISAGPTGFYGDQTKAAVAQWQAANNVRTGQYAGYFGPESQRMYNAIGATPAAAPGGTTSASAGSSGVPQSATNPAAQTPAGQAQSDRQAQIAKLTQLTKITPEEEELQKRLDAIDANLGKTEASQRMEHQASSYTTGRIANAGIMAEAEGRPLKAKLALLQARRQAAIEGIETELKYADKADTSVNTQVVDVGGRKLLINQKTGQTIKDLGVSPSGESTVSDTNRALRSAAIVKARPALKASRGTDGYVDPSVYTKLREDWAAAIGDSKEFNDLFSYLLSPAERVRLGIEKAKTSDSLY